MAKFVLSLSFVCCNNKRKVASAFEDCDYIVRQEMEAASRQPPATSRRVLGGSLLFAFSFDCAFVNANIYTKLKPYKPNAGREVIDIDTSISCEVRRLKSSE